ncbi:MAG TPA: ArsR family transcriptional regulator [Bacteroidales bacterium]|nr:ArsR family transcriptional regulator [Bacteroidales bacterium]HPS61911.1 ArsR family transcriptional regulator [Bacteroidales bacterium]
MLDALITNKTRVKLLLRFFLNPESSSYLRGLEEEFGESTNAIRIELNRFESAGLLVSWVEKNRKMFTANKEHPLFPDIRSILRKHTGIDTIIEKVINNLGNINSAYLNNMTEGSPMRNSLDLYIFGGPIDEAYLGSLTRKATTLIKREIRCTVLPSREEKQFLRAHRTALMVWKSNVPGDINHSTSINTL